MSEPSLNELLEVAISAARLAGRRTLDFFNTRLDITTKADATPVTAADVSSEAIIRETIGKHFPTHTILGEEEGESRGSNSRYRWIIDPLDGTKSFIRGVPMYAVLVGLEIDGRPEVGAAYLPATDEMVAAADGLGCTYNGQPCRVSSVDSIEKSTLLTTSVPRCFAKSNAYATLMDRALFTAGWGDAYGHLLVATGRAEIMLDPKVSPWDVAALFPILCEAGGRISSWKGESGISIDDAVSTNAALHAQVLTVLKEAKPHS